MDLGTVGQKGSIAFFAFSRKFGLITLPLKLMLITG
jgi:hypothetical protein